MRKLADELKDKVFRHVYAVTRVGQRIAHRIKAIREGQDLTQGAFGERMGKKQSVVTRLEDPDYGKFSLRSLHEAAAALDVVLWVDFISFDEFQRRLRTEPHDAPVLSYEAEQLANARSARTAALIENASSWAAMTQGVHFPFTDDVAGAETVKRRDILEFRRAA